MAKASFIISALIIVLFTISSCDNEVNLAADWKDIPIVFGLIDQDNEANYIRLEKAFLDPNASALEIAQIADSLYYPDALVSIKNLTKGDEFFLEKVDATNESFPRDTGIFANDPSYLYKLSGPTNFEGGDEIELNIIRTENTDAVLATCNLISDIKLTSPLSDFGIEFSTKSRTDFRWIPPAEAGLYDIWLILHYDETDLTTQEKVQHTIHWPIVNSIEENLYSIPGDLFFKRIREELDPENTGVIDNNISRVFKNLDIYVAAGGVELFELKELLKVSSGGVTGAVEIDPYSNISEGFGIFSSYHILKSEGHFLTNSTVDSLRNGYITKHLRFQ